MENSFNDKIPASDESSDNDPDTRPAKRHRNSAQGGEGRPKQAVNFQTLFNYEDDRQGYIDFRVHSLSYPEVI